MGISVSYFVTGHPVSVNRAYMRVRPRARRDGTKARRVALTQAAVIWKEAVYYDTLNALPQARYPRCLWHPPVRVCYVFQGVQADADNLLKLTQDAIARAIGVDDRYFAIAGAEVWPDVQPSGVRITIEDSGKVEHDGR
jgi:Holliday junction resolvase RusA-like endonuclease